MRGVGVVQREDLLRVGIFLELHVAAGVVVHLVVRVGVAAGGGLAGLQVVVGQAELRADVRDLKEGLLKVAKLLPRKEEELPVTERDWRDAGL